MKKLLPYITMLFFAFSHNIIAQSDEFTKFENNKQINSIVVNKKMFDMMSNVKIDPNNTSDKAYFQAIKKTNNLRVYSSDNPTVKQQMIAAITSYIKSNNLQKHSTKNNPEAIITIYINNNGTEKNLSSFLSFHESTIDKDHIVFLVDGQLSFQEINAIAKKMNLPIKDSF